MNFIYQIDFETSFTRRVLHVFKQLARVFHLRARCRIDFNQVDETTLGLRQETVTQIDTRRAGEGKMMQLSNFWIIEHSKTRELEVYLTRLYENPDELFTANCYKYTLTFQ